MIFQQRGCVSVHCGVCAVCGGEDDAARGHVRAEQAGEVCGGGRGGREERTAVREDQPLHHRAEHCGAGVRDGDGFIYLFIYLFIMLNSKNVEKIKLLLKKIRYISINKEFL